jgi:methionine-rich copper-binding protein CopC
MSSRHILVLLALFSAATPLLTEAAGRLHLRLIKSEPAANDTLTTAPTTVKLWFTEPPELAVTSIKLLMPRGSDTTRISMSVVHRDAAERAAVVADIASPLRAGRYVIAWKTTASDGHPATGAIPFVVSTSGAARQ